MYLRFGGRFVQSINVQVNVRLAVELLKQRGESGVVVCAVLHRAQTMQHGAACDKHVVPVQRREHALRVDLHDMTILQCGNVTRVSASRTCHRSSKTLRSAIT